MDFVTAWKASSIVLTGAFGILGLVKDFKDKKTNKVTIWGYISLCGILVSTAFGVIAQLKESSDTDRAKQATARQDIGASAKDGSDTSKYPKNTGSAGWSADRSVF